MSLTRRLYTNCIVPYTYNNNYCRDNLTRRQIYERAFDNDAFTSIIVCTVGDTTIVSLCARVRRHAYARAVTIVVVRDLRPSRTRWKYYSSRTGHFACAAQQRLSIAERHESIVLMHFNIEIFSRDAVVQVGRCTEGMETPFLLGVRLCVPFYRSNT